MLYTIEYGSPHFFPLQSKSDRKLAIEIEIALLGRFCGFAVHRHRAVRVEPRYLYRARGGPTRAPAQRTHPFAAGSRLPQHRLHLWSHPTQPSLPNPNPRARHHPPSSLSSTVARGSSPLGSSPPTPPRFAIRKPTKP